MTSSLTLRMTQLQTKHVSASKPIRVITITPTWHSKTSEHVNPIIEPFRMHNDYFKQMLVLHLHTSSNQTELTFFYSFKIHSMSKSCNPITEQLTQPTQLHFAVRISTSQEICTTQHMVYFADHKH